MRGTAVAKPRTNDEYLASVTDEKKRKALEKLMEGGDHG